MKRKTRKNNLFNDVIKNKATRVAITRKSHLIFFNTYFSHYVKYETALFQKEMFAITEDQSITLAVICSFRNSAKSSINTMSYPIWGILGEQQKKSIMIVSQTKEQAGFHFKNLKGELESNPLLKRDMGPFHTDNEWNAQSIIIENYHARIIIASKEQSIRGIKHGAFRPDLIIVDDPDDLSSVKTKESRDTTCNWFISEILGLGDRNTKVVVCGNLLHQDSLIMRLKREIQNGTRSGIYREYPIIRDDGSITWPGKFPNMEAIEKERLKIGNKFVWTREFLLKIIDDSEPIVDKSFIHYYDKLPEELYGQRVEYAIGVDLAISEKDTADYTSLVCAKIYYYQGKRQIYILPNPINKRMSINETIETIKQLVASFGGRFNTLIVVEDTMMQGMLTQLLAKEHYRVEGLKIGNMDKRSRLHIASSLIQSGEVAYPKIGSQELLEQTTEFGTTTHDDLVDAFTTLILKLIEKNDTQQTPVFIKIVGRNNRGVFGAKPRRRTRRDWSKFIDDETRDLFSNHGRGSGHNDDF